MICQRTLAVPTGQVLYLQRRVREIVLPSAFNSAFSKIGKAQRNIRFSTLIRYLSDPAYFTYVSRAHRLQVIHFVCHLMERNDFPPSVRHVCTVRQHRNIALFLSQLTSNRAALDPIFAQSRPTLTISVGIRAVLSQPQSPPPRPNRPPMTLLPGDKSDNSSPPDGTAKNGMRTPYLRIVPNTERTSSQ